MNKFLKTALLFTLLNFELSHADEEITRVNPQSPSAQDTPWLTGSLIAPLGEIVPKGHLIFQTFFYFNTVTGAYSPHWHDKSNPKFFNFTLQNELIIGLTKRIDFQILPTILYNHTQKQSSNRFGDFPIIFDFQIVRTDKFQWFPGIKMAITETFPTGKYQKLNPKKLNTGVSGLGSFATTGSLVFYKIYHLIGLHFLSVNASFSYSYFAPVHVRGFNTYGGGWGCAGKVFPGNSYSAILSFEITLDRNWAFAIDNIYTHSNKDHFKGNPGINSAVGRRSSETLSFTPSIEYNFNENWGIIAGAWISATGRNAAVFRNAIISCVYQY